MPDLDQLVFSETGVNVAVCSIDGRLRIWETVTSTLKQEFTPASHLTSGCSCLAWSPSPNQPVSGKKKKKKKVFEGEIIAMGTRIGSLMFYEVGKAQLIAHSKDAHSGKVTAVAWSSNSLALYSCGEDGFILEWDPSTANVTSRWKSLRKGLTAMCAFNDNLLVAEQGISMWDLSTKTLLSTFTGHASHITQINAIPQSDYFISMARGDRNLKIWHIGEKNSIVTLVVPQTPRCFHVSTKEDGNVSVAVATQQGVVHVFQKKLNGHMRVPLMPTSTLQVNDSEDKSGPKVIPILACFLREEVATSLLVAYGSLIKFRCEKFDVESIEKQGPVFREFASMKRNSEKSHAANNQLAEVPSDVKHLQPGTESATASKTGTKRKKAVIQEDGELPMEDRLTNLTLQAPEGLSAGIRGNNLAHLLSQGLHSKDARILQSVLSRWDEDIIVNTVRSLPVQLVVGLLNEIKVMLSGKGQLNNAIVKWLKCIIQTHSSYLMCCPAADDLLGPFMSLLHSREALYPRLCQLKGKLELVRANVDAKQHKSEPVNEALLIFNDDSSADEIEDDDAGLMAESEDLLSSDDLGESDSGGESDEKSGEKSGSGDQSDSDNENCDETHVSQIKSKRSRPTNTISLSNHKIKGKILDEDSGPESMDEDG